MNQSARSNLFSGIRRLGVERRPVSGSRTEGVLKDYGWGGLTSVAECSTGLDTVGDFGSDSGSFIARLKSLIAFPSAPPTSPSLLGPKMMRTRSRMISKCDGANRSIIVLPAQSRWNSVYRLS